MTTATPTHIDQDVQHQKEMAALERRFRKADIAAGLFLRPELFAKGGVR